MMNDYEHGSLGHQCNCGIDQNKEEEIVSAIKNVLVNDDTIVEEGLQYNDVPALRNRDELEKEELVRAFRVELCQGEVPACKALCGSKVLVLISIC